MGVQISGGGVVINGNDRYVVKDGKRYEIPNHVTSNVITTVNDTVYVGGYELTKNGIWKRTLKAFYYCYIF